VRIEVKLFAMLRERAGAERVEVELPEGGTVGDLLGELSGLVGAMPVRAAVNRSYSDESRTLRPGDEVALVPPVSGGGVDVHAAVSPEPLSLERLARMVVRDRAGAVVSFQGITREVERLDYEAYVEMALERIEAILAEIHTRIGLTAIAAEHRVGSVPLGEPSVIVAASAAHRSEAFEGAREAIDRIKAEAPIWKRELPEEGGEGRWVEGTTPSAS
jgi:molybdopterin synthase catalytic subunit/molybdopterin converting factor small subunit